MKTWVTEKGKEFSELQVWLKAYTPTVSVTCAFEFLFINISVIL